MQREAALEYIPLDRCIEDTTQPRQSHSQAEHKRLLASIMRVGQLVPGHVQRTEDGLFRIDSGARRFRALKAARERIPEDPRFQHFWAVCGGDADERRKVVVQWATNAFREDVAPIEKALYVARIAETFGQEIRAELGLNESEWRQCRQVASAPEWLQKFGCAQRYDVTERDSSGVVQVDDEGRSKKRAEERAPLPLTSIVRLMRHMNKLHKCFVERDGQTKGEALTYSEVLRLAQVAQREEWSKRQLDDACNRSLERASSSETKTERTTKFANDDKELRIVWSRLSEMSQQELKELEIALENALERVRCATAKGSREPKQEDAA